MPGKAEGTREMTVGDSTVWNATVVHEALANVNHCRPVLLEDLKELMNSYHGADRPLRYYDIFAGMWLEQFMHVCYAAFRGARVPSIRCTEPDPPCLEQFTTPGQFSRHLENSRAYLTSLTAVIGRLLAYQEPIAIFPVQTAGGHQDLVRSRVREARYVGRRLLKKFFLMAFFCRRPSLLLCAPYFQCQRRDWAAVMWKWRHWARLDDFAEEIPVLESFDERWRYDRSARAEDRETFLGALRSTMPLCIPSVFLEGFEAFRRHVLALRKPRPKVVYTANALHGNLVFKLLAAEWSLEGTQIVCHQHGGGYGLDYIHAIENYETRVADLFYTWGWKSTDAKIRPLSVGSHRIERLPWKKKGKVLLVCVEYPKYFYRLHFQPMPGTIETMIRDTITFLEGHSDHKDLLIRPYSIDYGWGFLEKLHKAASDAEFDTGRRRRNIFRRYTESALVVHNYLGTSYLQTLALNVPTVCFYDPETYKFREEARPHIESLQSVNILHGSARSAVSFVNELRQDVKTWWESADVQNARKGFCSVYANFSTEWDVRWESEFMRIIEK